MNSNLIRLIDHKNIWFVLYPILSFCCLLYPTIGFSEPAPALCQLYGVNDEGLSDSQFFTISLDENHTIDNLGPLYPGFDIEALAVHPRTNMIYAASGDNVTNGKQGHLYQVDGITGELHPIGSTGFNEIEDLVFGPDGALYAWAKYEGLIKINNPDVDSQGILILPSSAPLEGLTLKENEEGVFFGAVGTDLWQYDAVNGLNKVCSNLLGETEALEIMSDGRLLMGTHQGPLYFFEVENCEVIPIDGVPSNSFNDVEGFALPVEVCSSLGGGSGNACQTVDSNDLQVFEAIFMEPYVLFNAIMPMVVVDYDTSGSWPIPLSYSVTPPTGQFTAGFVSGEPPLYLEATMRSQTELETALINLGADMTDLTCLADVAGKSIRFIFDPSLRTWSCSVNIPNGVPPQYLDLFPMACD